MLDDAKELYEELTHEWSHAMLDAADEFWEHVAEKFYEIIG